MQIEEILSQTLTELVRSEQACIDWPEEAVYSAGMVSECAGRLMGSAIDDEFNQIQKEAIQTIVAAIRLLKNLK